MSFIFVAINDPEHPLTLEELNVLENSHVEVSFPVGLWPLLRK